jgi:uncharacterized membrane protein
MFRLTLLWHRLKSQMWWRPTLWSIFAVFAALAGASANYYVPDSAVPDIERETLQSLLTIIASSMLAVSTFSLSILVGAFTSASTSATPRATRLVMADDRAQSAIASFIAAFIYAIIALCALGVGYYGPAGRFVLLAGTIGVLVYIIVSLLRWIQTLSSIGRMSTTIATVEKAATTSLQAFRRNPFLGAHPAPGQPVHGVALHVTRTGYLQHIDMERLNTAAKKAAVTLHVVVRPGAMVHPADPVAFRDESPGLDMATLLGLEVAFVIGAERSFEQDPRFGLIVMAEIGQRALSPSTNDPGTAIGVIAAIARILIDTAVAEERRDTNKGISGGVTELPATDHSGRHVRFPCVTLVALDESDLIFDTFDPIARDGAGFVEIGVRLQKTLRAISLCTHGELPHAARRQAWRAFERARQALVFEEDKIALEKLATETAQATAVIESPITPARYARRLP